MKLKNEALQKLYDTIVNCTITIAPYVGFDSPIDKAFKDCDEKLSGSATFEHIKNLQDRIDMLQQDHESDVRVIGKLHSQMVDLEDEKTEQEKRADILKSQRDMLNKELDKANEKNRELKEDRDIWVRNNGEKQAEIAELKKQLDGALEAKKAVNDSRYKWAQKWLSTKQNLETKLNEAERKLDEVTSQYQELSIKLKRIQIDVGRESRLLWDMLQNVNDTQPNEFDVECESMHDVIGMDLEDFLDAYEKWQDQKETDRMRNWLVDFCVGRVCKECPLGSQEYKCGCGYSFKRRDRFDTRIIPDEDIKRYYEKARGCGRYPFAKPDDPCSGVREKVKEACDAFSEGLKAGLASEVKKPKPGELVITIRGVTTVNYSEATMNAIKEAVRKLEKSLPALDSWESTITGSIKVDDILEKTNGTEHKLEYGDAVRLPWRDRDYMYIGPSKANPKHIRLFDPKNHAVVVTFVTNVRYNGGKIIICDEDDLRKIWKDYE